MNKGRRTTSTEVKKLQGTMRNDRIKNGTEFKKLSALPTPADYLSALAKNYFEYFGNILLSKGMLYDADIHLLHQLSIEQATYEEASRNLKTAKSKVVSSGEKGYQQQSPWLGIRNNAAKNVRELSALFGFDPVSRLKFGGGGSEKPQNKFSQ